ncbi:hypothetical protein LSCM1_07289 [Leishmania martiniquensis]|uniref:Abscisic acid G-protein coupled receptor-like domain-containing protein n=1 Tax=Leishmania martiniquensis TaxID=1580590 RepID=A0A836KTA9_9TRYP|nr:hypothetical protein LSCM1_07289 [Leishmania martiniquensis]
MSLLYVVASYAVFFYVGKLLMRLVVVQPMGDASAAQCCFASTFALSLSLFSAVLVDMAEVSLHPSAAVAADTAVTEGSANSAAEADGGRAQRRPALLFLLQPRMQVGAQSFTWLLLLLLSTVLIACPAVCVISCLRHALARGSNRHVSGRRYSTLRRPSRSASGCRSLSACFSHRSRPQLKSRSSYQRDWEEGKRSRGMCRRLRRGLLWTMVVSLICTGMWAARTRRFDVRLVRTTSMSAARRVYTQLQRSTAILNVPREIKTKGTLTAGGDSAAGRVVEPVAGAKAEMPGESGEAAEQAQSQHQSQRQFSVPNTLHSMTSTVKDLRAFVCAVASRVATVGVAMIGLLSGYAAITSPYAFLAPYTYWRGHEDELRKAQRNFNKKLCHVLNGYGTAQRQIAALQYGVLHEEWASPAFSSAVSPSPQRGYSLSPSRQAPVVPSIGRGDGLRAPDHTLYPGSNHIGCSTQGGLPGGSDLWQSAGLDHLSAPVHIPHQHSSPGAVGWLRQKLSSAAQMMVSRASGSLHGGCASTTSRTSSISSPALSRQWAAARIQKLRDESAASHYLGLSMYLQLYEVEGMLREAQRGATWVGRWYAGLGVFMAAYSAIKIGLTVASLWLFKASTRDPVTQAVTLLENAFILRRRGAKGGTSFSVTAVEVSTHVILALALVVNGWMVMNSVRGALLALFHVTMSFSGSAISRPETIAIGLSMMIGVYFVGQLVMLRSSLPGAVASPLDGVPPSADSAPSNVLLAVLGSLPYYYYQRLNDWCFLVGCGGAIVVRRFVLRDTVSSVLYAATGDEERYTAGWPAEER